VFVLDSGFHVFVWIGTAVADERKHALSYAYSYLADAKRPESLPITVLMEGQHSAAFERFLVRVTRDCYVCLSRTARLFMLVGCVEVEVENCGFICISCLHFVLP
jgi:hypothetical protein